MTSNGVLRKYVAADLPRVSQWLGRGLSAITDYGLFAISNFALSLLLARWLDPSDYGAFTVGYTIFLLLGMFHLGLISDPMLVFGANRNRHQLKEYLDTVMVVHLGLVGVAALAFVLIGLGLWMAGSSALYATVFSMGLAAPCILQLWFIRASCYVYLTTHLAAAGGLLYLLLICTGAYMLHLRNWLSPVSAIWVMGISSFLVALGLAARLKQGLPRIREDKVLHDTLSSHWQFGRWMTGVNLMEWFITSIWYVVLPAWGGLAASGAFRALVIFIIPPIFALYAISRILMGNLVRARGGTGFEQSTRVMLLSFTSVSAVYWILLGTFAGFVLKLYGGLYGEYQQFLWLLGATLPLEAAGMVFRTALQALERPALVFWSYVVSAIAVGAIGLPLALGVGVWGAATGLLLGSFVKAGLMGMSLARARRESELQGAAVEVA